MVAYCPDSTRGVLDLILRWLPYPFHELESPNLVGYATYLLPPQSQDRMRAALVASKAVARGIECSGSRTLCSNSQGVAGRSLVSGSGGNGGVRRSRWESTRHLC